MSFEDLIQLPIYQRRVHVMFMSFWMTSDGNFKIILKIEAENAKKEEIQKEKENIKKEAVAKA